VNEKREKKEKKESKKRRKENESSQDATDTTISTESSDYFANYKEHPAVAGRSRADVETFRKESRLIISEEGFNPICSFSESTFPKELLAACTTFTQPTSIQSQCWPILLSGRDAIGIAETGSGKTLAFLMPAFTHLFAKRRIENDINAGPSVLILAPTRELAQQSAVISEKMCANTGFSSICVYGGVDKKGQVNALRKGVQIIIATPGRLLDLFNDSKCNLSNVTYFVLDEADRMLDMGFEPEIRKIAAELAKKRQTVMFSATWPDSIRRLAEDYIKSPIKVNVGSESLAANLAVTQIVEVIDNKEKDRRLIQLLEKYHKTRKNKVLVFALYKKEASRLENFLQNRGYKVVSIHGDMTQLARNQAFEEFRTGKTPLLVATDVAARGLDIKDVEYVINYTFPLTIEDYIHRIGRTGRAGKTGTAHTLFTSYDKARSGELGLVLRDAGQYVPEELLKLGNVVKKKEHSLYGSHYKDASIMPDASTRKHIKFD
jgi:ATP-dependent RNA helicase DBP3